MSAAWPSAVAASNLTSLVEPVKKRETNATEAEVFHYR